MMRKQLILLLLCLFHFLVQIPAAPAEAASGGTRLTYETNFTGSETALTGTASQQQYFAVMDYWNVDQVIINLHFQITQINADQLSSVTLSLNGIPFYSFRPSSDNNGEQSLRIPAPRGFLKAGSNNLSIQGNLKTSVGGDELCSMDDAQDSWLHLFNTSNIAVVYSLKEITGGIADFSARFSGPDTLSGGHSLLAVPEKASGAELESAAYALAGLAKANTLAGKTIPLLPYREDTAADKRAVVLVAMYDRLPEPLKSLITKTDDLGTHAVIQLVNKDASPVLVVTSSDESLLIKAGRLLASRELLSQLSGDLKVVDDTTDVADPAPPINSNITFTETGDKLNGPNHREQTYFVSLPANRSIADNGKISIDFRYAGNLDFDRSLVTVSINNTPIGSKKLTKELANGDVLNLSVPQSLGISGNFSVTVAFDLEMANAVCTPNKEQMPWAYISKESLMQLNTKDRTDLLLSNYPYPFLRDEIFNHVAVVLPQEMDDYSYQSLGHIFNLLGQYAGGNTGDIHFYTDEVNSDNLTNNNIIAIGTYKNNRIIRDNNDKLFFRYNKDGSTLVSNEKIAIEEQYGAGIGTLQLLDSPYAGGRALLAVTAVRPESYYLASRLIASEQDRWKVYGDGVMTDTDGTVNAYRFKTVSGALPDSVVSQVLERTDVLGFVAAAVLTVTLVLLSLLLLLRKHKKKRGDKRET
ncbi:cellulose biosynthesis cyclic di-GMP-binding regulatory protein BcsB [Paenibacillus sp. MMS20-IR301]|uniref:cellulose biosynthesis cyclic di-GMP-binding regulatory protein BcsB n=1 Tax=Paenibacillus sp. MMS20-IR301 TaxID=2895946 RepID=UPI0028EB42FD|nr:cellulose biosynthesis cyclic di-GMP-binding regulatory protein BcsB [Paenibacillus sp. MMS20-IR301]WNS42451.1 cellulose biosynthesis cyclic di-GMP-binding regulatory protein BcsB [Paenibacillus sp. MMS20-IR301]